ncbi:MAG TPA: outer membrane lipoprotein-sorting protein [Chthoniobacterales bacterium]|jgi:outer membrane lipoprotein-sorting protein
MDEQRENELLKLFMSLHFTLRWFVAVSVVFLATLACAAADPESDLASALRAKEEGSKFIRVRMQIGSGENQILQLQIKSRVSNAASDIVYQVLFPKERKGEAVLLHRSGEKVSGTTFTPLNTVRPIAVGQMNEPLFGSDLSYEDIIDNPFRWPRQAIVGAEAIDNIQCQILESKPGKGHSSSYSSVKTWVDPHRLVPLLIEKYDSSGKVLRRINTTRVLLDGNDSLPADLKVYGPRDTVTKITGSRIKRGVTYPDTEFTPEGLKQLTTPPGSPP